MSLTLLIYFIITPLAVYFLPFWIMILFIFFLRCLFVVEVGVLDTSILMTGDSGHFISIANSFINTSLNDYTSFREYIYNLNKTPYVDNQLNGTVYGVIGGFLNYISNVKLVYCFIFLNQIVVLFNILIMKNILNKLNSSYKLPILIYLTFPTSFMYSMTVIKDIFLSFIYLSSVCLLIKDKKKFMDFILLALCILVLILDRWYLIGFLFFSYFAIKFLFIFSFKQIMLSSMFLLFLIFLIPQLNLNLSIIYHGFTSNQSGLFGEINILYKILLWPLFILKLLISPNPYAMYANLSLEHSNIYFLLYFYHMIFISCVFIFFFKILNKIYFNFSKIFLNINYSIYFYYCLFFVASLSLYSTSHGRVREAIMPLLLCVIFSFILKKKSKNFKKNK